MTSSYIGEGLSKFLAMIPLSKFFWSFRSDQSKFLIYLTSSVYTGFLMFLFINYYLIKWLKSEEKIQIIKRKKAMSQKPLLNDSLLLFTSSFSKPSIIIEVLRISKLLGFWIKSVWIENFKAKLIWLIKNQNSM